MKKIILILLAAIINCSACSASDNNLESSEIDSKVSQYEEIIATANGVDFTEAHFQMALTVEAAFEGLDFISIVDQVALKSGLIEIFLNEPHETLKLITDTYADIKANGKITIKGDSGIETEGEILQSKNMPQGHLYARQGVENFYTANGLNYQLEMSFDDSNAAKLRSYIVNSQLSYSSSDSLGPSYRNYSFCADGTFLYNFSSASSVHNYSGTEQLYSGTERSGYSGYWDTAYSKTGSDMLILMSTSPDFIEEASPLPFIPLPIAAYQADVIQLGANGQAPTPDMLLRRSAAQGCY